ncbi:hypothetical protein R6Q59_002401 [Mikania micrantha]|uniref:Ferredoxin thioredoxin reductase alpha chain domain-containing protein n=1 Tax=Mikania micrantha TaxID=192012 RepID=A0A5N6NR98_9ASTR|nr:hypothetical protein E3N88_19443 [Mikania micrantha]
MTSPATLAAATPINSPPSAVKPRAIPTLLRVCSCNGSLSARTLKRSNPVPWTKIKASASDSTAVVDVLTPTSTSEEEIPAKVGARVRVKVPLKVYHIPRVPEVDLNGVEGKIKEYVAVWKGKNISANFPYKIEFLEKLEGRGDAPVKFFAHLKDDEFEYLD